MNSLKSPNEAVLDITIFKSSMDTDFTIKLLRGIADNIQKILDSEDIFEEFDDFTLLREGFDFIRYKTNNPIFPEIEFEVKMFRGNLDKSCYNLPSKETFHSERDYYVVYLFLFSENALPNYAVSIDVKYYDEICSKSKARNIFNCIINPNIKPNKAAR